MKRNIKITYEYDGSKFFGFQKQPHIKTVQGEIEKIIKKDFSEEINLISAGRTDKGVHALGQVSNFYINGLISVNSIKKHLNKNLKNEIKILEIEEVDDEFHARFSAKSREYRYIMKKKNDINVFESNYISPVKSDIDVDKFYKILSPLIGRHNFDSFRKKDDSNKNPEREIIDISVFEDNSKIFIDIEGVSFLKTMIRIMIGSALAVYFEDVEEDYIMTKLEKPNIDDRKILAKPQGLYFKSVKY